MTSVTTLVLGVFCMTVAIFTLSVEAKTRQCKLERFGDLAMFNGETASVEVPCKFRLADLQCGDFRLSVTPGQAVDSDTKNRFSLNTLRVKVVSLTNGHTLVLRSSSKLLDKAAANNTNPWRDKTGKKVQSPDVDTMGYSSSLQAAVLGVNQTFQIVFSTPGHVDTADKAGVTVTCFHDNFTSTGLKKSLCGDGTTMYALRGRKAELFGCGNDVTHAQFFHHFTLASPVVTQSPRCTALAQQFKSCPFKQNAVRVCEALLGKVMLARCLAADPDTTLQQLYGHCLSYACQADVDAVTYMRTHVKENCPGLIDSVPKGIC